MSSAAAAAGAFSLRELEVFALSLAPLHPRAPCSTSSQLSVLLCKDSSLSLSPFLHTFHRASLSRAPFDVLSTTPRARAVCELSVSFFPTLPIALLALLGPIRSVLDCVQFLNIQVRQIIVKNFLLLIPLCAPSRFSASENNAGAGEMSRWSHGQAVILTFTSIQNGGKRALHSRSHISRKESKDFSVSNPTLCLKKPSSVCSSQRCLSPDSFIASPSTFIHRLPSLTVTLARA